MHLFLLLKLGEVGVVVFLDLVVGGVHVLGEIRRPELDHLDAHALGLAVPLLILVVVRLDVLVGERHLRGEARGRQAHELQVHALVVEVEAILHLGGR